MDSIRKRKGLICIGINTIDIQHLVQKFPQSNSKIRSERNEVFVGGPATNAAITAAFLGIDTDLVTPVGNHLFADFVRKDLSIRNVNLIDPVASIQWAPTFASIITDRQNGERTVISYHPEIKISVDIQLKLVFKNYQLALFDGFYPELAIPMARECKRQGITTVLDGGSWKKVTDRLLPFIDIALCSDDFQVPRGRNKKDVINYLHAKGVKYVAVTRGEKQILLSEEGKIRKMDVRKVDVFDTLGAGDIFHGAFCFYYITDCKFADAIRKASNIAGDSCRYFGTREWMENYKIEHNNNINNIMNK